MQNKMFVTKPEQALSRTNNPMNNNLANKKPDVNKKNVRTTDYKKLQKIMLNDPDAITREEFLFLQSVIGYRQAVIIKEEAKLRKTQKKIEETAVVTKPISLENPNSGILNDIEEKNPSQMKMDDGNTAASSSALPFTLKAGLEKLSGIDLSDVKVHENSDKPQQFGALAYTQGNEIHIAPGQERHLPHEGWHAIQQKQGKVEPSMQLKTETLVNDDESLEKEADDMGRRASEEYGNSDTQQLSSKVTQTRLSKGEIIQRAVSKEKTYVVKKGDTLSEIAIKNNVTQDELIKLNKIKDKDTINVGQVLKLPSAAKVNTEVKNEEKTYVVKKGDTLGGIAIKYNVSQDELIKLNKIKDKDTINVGQVLKLPTAAKLTPEVKNEEKTSVVEPAKTTPAPGVDNNKKNEDTGSKVTDNDIINNFRNDTRSGIPQAKKETMITVLSTLLNKGYKPAFAAGVLGNILAEGSAGYFESSAYKKTKEPGYLVYMDENFNYREEFSGKHISKVGVKKTYAVLKKLEKVNYKGKFGLGACQWTGARTMSLIKCYIDVCGEDAFPTAENCLVAENAMVVKEIDGSYNYVYKDWKSKYGKSNGADAAYGAGSIVCYKYEVPHDTDTQAKIRADNAKKIYNAMMGSH